MSFIDNTPGGTTSKDEIIKTLRDEIAQQNMSALITRMHKRCYQKCVPNPGSSLSSSESQCLSDCAQKYLHMLDVTSRQWNSTMSNMRSKAGL